MKLRLHETNLVRFFLCGLSGTRDMYTKRHLAKSALYKLNKLLLLLLLLLMCIATISYGHAAYAAEVLSKRQRLRTTCLRCPRPIYRELSCCYVYLLLLLHIRSNYFTQKKCEPCTTASVTVPRYQIMVLR